LRKFTGHFRRIYGIYLDIYEEEGKPGRSQLCPGRTSG
jgi:hypothetical protein